MFELGHAGLFSIDFQRPNCKLNRAVGLDPLAYGTHALRWTKASMIRWRTGNLRAVELPLGHTKLESTLRYSGIEADDALTISEQVEM